MKRVSPIIMFVLCIAVGLWTVILSIRGELTATWQPALGVVFIVIGLNGFTSLRISKLEKTIKDMQRSNDRQH
jgi:hypothetical protein